MDKEARDKPLPGMVLQNRTILAETIVTEAPPPDPDTAASVPEVKKMTVDEVVDDIIGRKPRMLHVLIVVVAMSYGLSVDSLTYLTVFGGTVPYDNWRCVSEHCKELYRNATDKENFYKEKVLCESHLKIYDDFVFNTNGRTSLAIEWGLFCKDELKMATLSSIIFAGAYVGFLGASLLFDKFGRKKVTIMSGLLSFIAVLGSAFSPNYNTMLIMRFLMGVGKNVCWAGLFCWILEFTPASMTIFMSAVGYTSHGMGLLLLDFVAFNVHNWRHIFIVISMVTFLSILPQIFLPESPRFLISRHRATKAKAVLEKVSKLVGTGNSLQDTELDYKVHEKSITKLMGDFVKYPNFGRQSLILASLWLFTCSLGYTFNFGWSKLSNDMYVSYVLASISSMVGYSLMIPVEKLAGKKRGLLCLLGGCVAFFCLAMVDYEFTENWSVERVASLLGFLCTISANTMTYTFTGDVTPTSHRGMVFCICGSFGRIGSFLGPYLQLLFTLSDKRIPFGIFAGIALLCIAGVLLTTDPSGKPMPQTPLEVE